MSTHAFLTDETGAVTVDWVVLTGALVGLGLAVMAVVRTGVSDVSGDIAGTLERDSIIRVAFSTALTDRMSEGGVAYHFDRAAGLSNEELSSEWPTRSNRIATLTEQSATWPQIADSHGSWGPGNPLVLGGETFPDRAAFDAHMASGQRSIQANYVYLDEASQRGLSWNEATGAFE